MKTPLLAALGLLPLAAAHLRTPAASSDLDTQTRDRIATEVSAFLADYLVVIEAGEPDAIRELYVDDERFTWVTDGEKAYETVDELLASLASMEGMTFSTESSDVEVLPLTAELAHASSGFQTKITQNGQLVFQYGGVITWLLERSEAEGWRVLRGHTSTPKPR